MRATRPYKSSPPARSKATTRIRPYHDTTYADVRSPSVVMVGAYPCGRPLVPQLLPPGKSALFIRLLHDLAVALCCPYRHLLYTGAFVFCTVMSPCTRATIPSFSMTRRSSWILVSLLVTKEQGPSLCRP